MNAKITLVSGQPGENFWKQYTLLWQNSVGRSPFQAPHLLQLFAKKAGDKWTVLQFLMEEHLVGALHLQASKGVYTFLSDFKTDMNFFVINRKCPPSVQKEIFTVFLKTVKEQHWTVMLNNQPTWAPYMEQLEAAGRKSGLFWRNIPYSVCPYLEADSPDALFKRINASRELRYRVNKLRNQENAEFEVLTDDLDLEHWLEEFCDAHVLRWADTPSPSAYRAPERRAFLLDCLKAWCADDLLVRFAVKTAKGRIGFVIALREADSLIHHSTTFHPDYWKHSPGKALIHFMSEWMSKNGFRMLDFGDGNEPYKYTVADKEHPLNRIFISSPANLCFILKTQMIQWVRHNERIYNFYRDKIKVAAQSVQS